MPVTLRQLKNIQGNRLLGSAGGSSGPVTEVALAAPLGIASGVLSITKWPVYLTLSADFSTTSTTPSAVTGLSFTPAANKTYICEAYLLCKTSVTTTGAQPGYLPPTVASFGGFLFAPASATSMVQRWWGSGNAVAAGTGLPNTTATWLHYGKAVILSGASPSGSFGISLASEVSGSSVTMVAGSMLVYREAG